MIVTNPSNPHDLIDDNLVSNLLWAAIQRVEVKQWDSHKLDLDHKLDLLLELRPLVRQLVCAVNPDASALSEELGRLYKRAIEAEAKFDSLSCVVSEKGLQDG